MPATRSQLRKYARHYTADVGDIRKVVVRKKIEGDDRFSVGEDVTEHLGAFRNLRVLIRMGYLETEPRIDHRRIPPAGAVPPAEPKPVAPWSPSLEDLRRRGVKREDATAYLEKVEAVIAEAPGAYVPTLSEVISAGYSEERARNIIDEIKEKNGKHAAEQAERKAAAESDGDGDGDGDGEGDKLHGKKHKPEEPEPLDLDRSLPYPHLALLSPVASKKEIMTALTADGIGFQASMTKSAMIDLVAELNDRNLPLEQLAHGDGDDVPEDDDEEDTEETEV
jgi:hypothetical protein